MQACTLRLTRAALWATGTLLWTVFSVAFGLSSTFGEVRAALLWRALCRRCARCVPLQPGVRQL